MLLISHNSLLVHVAYLQILVTKDLVIAINNKDHLLPTSFIFSGINLFDLLEVLSSTPSMDLFG